MIKKPTPTDDAYTGIQVDTTSDRTSRLIEESSTGRGMESPKAERWVPSAAIAVSVLALWLPYLRTSFWLDETGTAWIVSGTLGQTISRSGLPLVVGQSPLYYIVDWLTRQILGPSEIALRVPSLLAGLGTMWVIYRIALRLFDRTAAALGAVVFASLTAVAFTAVDARPYSIGMLAFALATLMLIRWEEEQRRRFAVGYIIFVALTIYITYMFGVALLAHLIYAMRRSSRDGFPVSRLLAGWVAAGILCIPALPHLVTLLRSKHLFDWYESHNTEYFYLVQILLPVVAGLLVPYLVLRMRNARATSTESAAAATWLTVSIALVSPVVFWVLSYTLAPKFFVHRYFLVFLVGIALVAGKILSSMPARERYIGIVVLLLIPLVGYRGSVHGQDWRGAAGAISARAQTETPILLAGFATQPTADAGVQAFLRAPLSVYRVKGRIVLLPFDLSAANQPLMQSIIQNDLRTTRRFFVVTGFNPRPFSDWIANKLGPEGFTDRVIFTGPWIIVTEFDRPT